MPKFDLQSEFQPAGDQPAAIKALVDGLKSGKGEQTLMGVTGSGKTFTMANVIQELQRPALVLSHNKTLAAQLYSEFKEFFPNNAVSYFVSYYDYYQPRRTSRSATSTSRRTRRSTRRSIECDSRRPALSSRRRDVIVVASVSCIYGLGSPEDYKQMMVGVACGTTSSRSR